MFDITHKNKKIPVLVEGAHCPFCCGTVYKGPVDGSFICAFDGEISETEYRYLWRKFTGYNPPAKIKSDENVDNEIPVGSMLPGTTQPVVRLGC